MKKILLVVLLFFNVACSTKDDHINWQDPDYNYIASHVRVINKSPNFVTYGYKDIRIDEVAPVAAIYCYDRGKKQAKLYEITMQPDNTRSATFVCSKANTN